MMLMTGLMTFNALPMILMILMMEESKFSQEITFNWVMVVLSRLVLRTNMVSNNGELDLRAITPLINARPSLYLPTSVLKSTDTPTS